jgi:serine/threonine-protein kinase
VILYKLSTGKVPFNAPNSNAVVVQHVMEQPPAPRSVNGSIPVAVEAVVLRALQKKREARPATAGAFAQELIAAVNEFSGTQPTVAAPPVPNTPPQPGDGGHGASSPSTPPTLAVTTPFTGNPVPQPVGGYPPSPGTGTNYPPPNPPPNPPQPNKNYIPVIVGALLGLMLAGGAGFMLLRSNTGDGQGNVSSSKSSEERSVENRGSSNAGTTNNSSASSTNTAATNNQTPYARAEGKVIGGTALAESDLTGLSPYELQLLRNAVFARHGRTFKTPELQRYFDSRSWYSPRSSYSDDPQPDGQPRLRL